MTTTASATNSPPAMAAVAPLGSWVEAHAETCRGGRTYRVLVNHLTGQVIELTDTEAEICGLVDPGQGLISSPAVAAFVQELREQGFLASDPPPPPARRTVQFSAARLDVRWTGAGRLVAAACAHGARHLLRPAAVAVQALLALAGLAAVTAAIVSGQHFVLRVHPAQIPVVIGLSLAAVAVHELAHALVVVRHHRTVDAAGVRLHLGTPAFYVESASAVLLTRRQRLIQASAGVWAEWQFTSVVAIWLWVSPLPAAAPLLHRFVILNAATIATNLLPFTGLDGSWLLADATGIPDLARRSRGALTRLATNLIDRRPIPATGKALAAYAAANSLVALALLATSGFFWYQLFGDLATTLAPPRPRRVGRAGRGRYRPRTARCRRGRCPAARRRRHRPRPARRGHLPPPVAVADPCHPPARCHLPPARRPHQCPAQHSRRAAAPLPAPRLPPGGPGRQLRDRRRRCHQHRRPASPPHPRSHLEPPAPALPRHPPRHAHPHRRRYPPPAAGRRGLGMRSAGPGESVVPQAWPQPGADLTYVDKDPAPRAGTIKVASRTFGPVSRPCCRTACYPRVKRTEHWPDPLTRHRRHPEPKHTCHD